MVPAAYAQGRYRANFNLMKSSDYLFHFTSQLENIFSILENGIWVRRSVEDFSFLRDIMPDIDFEAVFGNSLHSDADSKDEEDYNISIPMACFCDIPVHEASSHSKIYGEYALGFDKSWGVVRGINPISYLVPESDLSTAIRSLNILSEKISSQSPNYRIRNAFFKIASFLKLYEGSYTKGGYSNPNHRFYDEREWRYVPKGDYIQISPPHLLNNQVQLIEEKIFVSLSDIRQIVVSSSAEEGSLKNQLKEKGFEITSNFEVISFEKLNDRLAL